MSQLAFAIILDIVNQCNEARISRKEYEDKFVGLAMDRLQCTKEQALDLLKELTS